MSGSRPHPRALSPLGSMSGRARSDTPATNTTRREEYEEEEVDKVKREFKIKLLDTYKGHRAKLIPWLMQCELYLMFNAHLFDSYIKKVV
jgi:hypothetical protein